MKIYNQYGTPERLFEMFKKVNKLNEELLPNNKKEEIVNEFVSFVLNKLDWTADIPKIKLSYNNEDAQTMKSFGQYDPDTNEIVVVAANRNLADILRTIAHELKHQHQKKEGKLSPDSGETGSPVENEANAFAGIVMREFGRKNPIIFE